MREVPPFIPPHALCGATRREKAQELSAEWTTEVAKRKAGNPGTQWRPVTLCSLHMGCYDRAPGLPHALHSTLKLLEGRDGILCPRFSSTHD